MPPDDAQVRKCSGPPGGPLQGHQIRRPPPSKQCPSGERGPAGGARRKRRAYPGFDPRWRLLGNSGTLAPAPRSAQAPATKRSHEGPPPPRRQLSSGRSRLSPAGPRPCRGPTGGTPAPRGHPDAGAARAVGAGDRRLCWTTGDGPTSIAADSGGKVYLTDTCNHRIQKFTSSGEFITQFLAPSDSWITGLAEDSAGDLYLLDANNSLIQKFTTPDGISYSYATQWGSAGSGDGQFEASEGDSNLAMDASDDLYVPDYGNERVLKFDSSGSFLMSIDCSQVQAYLAVAIDPAAPALYVLDVYDNSVHRYRLDGTLVDTWNGEGDGLGQVRYPSAFALQGDYLYILDFNVDQVTWSHNQIVKYEIRR